MKHTFFIFVAILFSASIAAAYAQDIGVQLSVTKVQPAPNYKMTKDKLDSAQLTDGKIYKYPSWTNKGSVGWSGRTPVVINLKFNDNSVESKHTGILSLYLSQGSINNKVEMPRRIDIYSHKNNGNYIHEKSVQIKRNQYKKNSNHILDIPLKIDSSEFVLIIHSQGKFIMLDEISWVNRSINNANMGNSKNVTYVKDVIKDSLKKLKKTYSQGYLETKNNEIEWKTGFDSDRFYSWNQYPWGGFDSYPDIKYILANDNIINLLGVDAEYESAAIGVLNTYGENKTVYIEVEADAEIAKKIEIRIVDKVLTSSGKLKFDPLLPIINNKVRLKNYEATYLWLTLNLNNVLPGIYDISLKVKDNSGFILTNVPVRLEVKKAILWPSTIPRAVTWAYYQDWPIWDNKNKVLADLLKHSVNVFVIHGATLPQPNLEKKWQHKKMEKLEEQLKFYSKNGKILLFMGWSYLYKMHNAIESQQKEAMQVWVKQLVSEISKLGFTYDEWAIYPVDEPYGKKLELLKKVAPWIKEADKRVQLYANPIASTNALDALDALVNLYLLNDYIDIWQPSLELASDEASIFFSGQKKEWWVYDNPKSPAKDTSPEFYRLLSWRAWKSGARGVGFWSYSATDHSSSWDDFDGIGPDWSVVYEDEAGPVSSRRWEAFREGIEDFKLFESFSSRADCSISYDVLLNRVELATKENNFSNHGFSRFRNTHIFSNCT